MHSTRFMTFSVLQTNYYSTRYCSVLHPAAENKIRVISLRDIPANAIQVPTGGTYTINTNILQ